MKILAYFAFTLLSIVMQFCVMDFIQDKPKLENKKIAFNSNSTSPKTRWSDVLEDYIRKPHALYYRTQLGRLVDKNVGTSTVKYNNVTLLDDLLETTMPSTVIDLLYDENDTLSEDVTTQSTFTSTELYNYTDIDIELFGKKNKTSLPPRETSKKVNTKECHCNLLYNVCDINCCCDIDCSEDDKSIFGDCKEDISNRKVDALCFPSTFYFAKDGMFCVAKANLPDKRNVNINKHDPSVVNKHYKWHVSAPKKLPEEITRRTYYKYGDPIKYLINDTVYHLDLPSTFLNNYCTDRTPLKFLMEDKVECDVKFIDLENFQILGYIAEAPIISFTEKSVNATKLNCSTVHCTHWRISACDKSSCTDYNKSIHEPACTDDVCKNIANQLEYTFYYYKSKIVNATVTLHIKNISPKIPFISQAISVKFFLANKSSEDVVKLSGSPGYDDGLPIIISHLDGNHTAQFFNNTTKDEKHWSYPLNAKGICEMSTKNDISFGVNKRLKCKYSLRPLSKNVTNACEKIQNNIIQLFGIKSTIKVSPLGNPQGLTDEEWISLPDQTRKTVLQDSSPSKLHCSSLITRVSVIFTYVNVESGRRILSVGLEVTPRNVTFTAVEVSTLLTMDTIFIDETKPSVYEYAGGPHLNIHLPKDFFYPFPSNNACAVFTNLRHVTLYICIALYFK